MELVIGGLAAVGAGTFSNPLEVVKIRMQLQGELLARGKYVKHYRNVFHGAYMIASKDGILALQKGLVPALCYQFVMNGTRLGTYNLLEKKGLTRNKDGRVNHLGSAIAGCCCGTLGAIVGSPFYLVKTHLQSKANELSIAVGHQHEYKSLTQAFKHIYQNHGFFGLWRGSSTAMMRVTVASGIQMLTFEKSLDFVRAQNWFPSGHWMTVFCASLISGVFVAFGMSPFDLIATRYYNQGLDATGKGMLYKSVLECPKKIFREEGPLGFFKGWTANYFRIGPHTLLLMVFWDRLKNKYHVYEQSKETGKLELELLSEV